MTTIVKSPVSIADTIFKAALGEQLEVIAENEKRAERFQEPLPIPAWNVKKMIENIKTLTAKAFTPQFRDFVKQYPYNKSSDRDEWAEMAIKRLRDDYLIRIAREDADVFRQLCEIWPELIPAPALTEQQRTELTNLQKQADAIIESAAAFMEDRIAELQKLAEREASIVRGTQSLNDKRIGGLVEWLEATAPGRYKNRFNRW